jgi:hypothetical protein
VNSNGKCLRYLIYPAIALLVAGCGGIHASKSVSPLDFILPGLMQSDPPPLIPDPVHPGAEPVQQQVAQF